MIEVNRSEKIEELTKARIEFNILMESEELKKDAKGGRGRYVTIEALQEATIPLLSKVGLTMEQITQCENNSEYLITTLYHVSGQFVRSIGYLYRQIDDMTAEVAQEYGKIMTYKQRYQWRSMLCLGRGSEDAEGKPAYQQYSKPVQQAVKLETVIGLTLPHQNEIFKIIKSDKEAENELCRVFNVKTFQAINDNDYEKLKTKAIKLVELWGI
jgi:hypothetical protein